MKLIQLDSKSQSLITLKPPFTKGLLWTPHLALKSLLRRTFLTRTHRCILHDIHALDKGSRSQISLLTIVLSHPGRLGVGGGAPWGR